MSEPAPHADAVVPPMSGAGQPRVLILGGSPFQMPLIRYAKEQGAFVITCDYLPDNPGHALADEYHNVSTTDMGAVLELARTLSVDAVLSFASEPALQTVSFVSEALSLHAPSLDAVTRLTDKGAFRRLLHEIDLPTPKAVTVTAALPIADTLGLMAENGIEVPCIVKPVDSSGSKGITVLDSSLSALPETLAHALRYSRSGHAIIEQYIEGEQIHGDGYLNDGRLVFHYLGDHVFFMESGCRVPVSTRWPTCHSSDVLRNVVEQVEAIARASGYRKGPVNIEARVTPQGDTYMIELSPRNGGNHVPIIIQHLTGFNFVRQTYLNATGGEAAPVIPNGSALAGAYYVLHSPSAGFLAGVNLSDAIRPHVFHLELFKREGDPVESFRGSNASLGVALLSFTSVNERDAFMNQASQHLGLRVRS